MTQGLHQLAKLHKPHHFLGASSILVMGILLYSSMLGQFASAATTPIDGSGTGSVYYALTVVRAGTGSGTVTSNLGGIDCGTACSASFVAGTTVIISATPATGSTVGLSGCTPIVTAALNSSASLTASTSCTVTMSANQTVTATFTTSATAPTVTSGAATLVTATSASLQGTTNPNGLATSSWFRLSTTSPGSCTDSFGTRLPATGGISNGSGSILIGYSYDVNQLSSVTTYYYCAIGENSAGKSYGSVLSFTTTATTPTFTLTVSKVGTGSGTVFEGTSLQPGSVINCGSVCSASFLSGATVTLTAMAQNGSTFAGWSGGCTGTGTCTITMSGAKSVTATFTLVASSGLNPGDLFKLACTVDAGTNDPCNWIYYMGSDGKRYVFPRTPDWTDWKQVFYSWGLSENQVKVVTPSQLQALPIGGDVTVRPGTWLVKISTDTSVYAISYPNVLHLVSSDLLPTLYGPNWSARVLTVPDAFWANYSLGAPLSSIYPDGTIFRYSTTTSGATYLLYGGQAMKFATDAAFVANRYSTADIQTALSAFVYQTGLDITGVQPCLTDVAQLTSCKFGATTSLTGSLVSGVNATPTVQQLVPVGTQGKTYLAVKLYAQGEAQKVSRLTLHAAGSRLHQNDLVNITLYRQVGAAPMDSTPFATASQFSTCVNNSCSTTWTATDNLLAEPVQPGTVVTIYAKASVGGGGIGYLGDDFYLSLDMTAGADITARGAQTGVAPTYAGGNLNGQSNARSNIVPFGVVVSAFEPTTPVTEVVATGTALGRFKLQNNGSAKVTLTSAQFADGGSHTGTNERYTLYASSENSSDYLSNSVAMTTFDTLNFGTLPTPGSATSPLTLNPGSYRYLTVVLSTAGSIANGDTFALGAPVLGYLSYSVSEADLGYDANQNGTLSDTASHLYVDGQPILSVITNSGGTTIRPTIKYIFGTRTIDVGGSAQFKVEPNNPSGGTLTYSASWATGTSVDTNTDGKFYHFFSTPGTYQVAFKMVDASGQGDMQGITVVVRDPSFCATFTTITEPALHTTEFGTLDSSKHPEVLNYRIQWFSGTWSEWYTPGVNDLDWKTNPDGSYRLVWAYFGDHTHEYQKCTPDGHSIGAYDVNVSNITSQGATVDWKVDQPATGRVFYGFGSSANDLSFVMPITQSTELATVYTIQLLNLLPNRTYYYKVEGHNATGYYYGSPVATFHTTSSATSLNDITIDAQAVATNNVDQVTSVDPSQAAALLQRAETIIAKIKVLQAELATITPQLKDFIALGTPTTQRLGQGERAGVVSSFASAFGKAPSTEGDWQDVIKIANGRWPTQRNQAKEQQAEEAFVKIYKREPQRDSNAHDDAAVTVMAYGLRPTGRNLGSEAAAAKSFTATYGHAPQSAADWDTVRAIAYSGARQ